MAEDKAEKEDDKFENPEPNPGESQKDFVSRCIPYVKKEHPDWKQDKIIAVCYSIYRRKHEGATLDDFMESLGYKRFTESAQFIQISHSEKSQKVNSSKQDTYKLVAMVGDRFMNGGYFSMEETEKCYLMWEQTYHDYNHEGTNSGTFGNRTDISKFIGYHKNVELDKANKRVLMDLVPVKETAAYPVWKGYIELAKQSGNIPNVSVTYYGKQRFMKASELPKEANYEREGFKESDMVPVLHNVIPVCVSTVLQGRCNDRDGCGIQNTNSECGSNSCSSDSCKTQDAKKHEEQIKRIKEKEKKLKSED